MWSWALSSTGTEAENSPPSSAKVKNEWSFTSTPAYVNVLYTGSVYLHNYNEITDTGLFI